MPSTRLIPIDHAPFNICKSFLLVGERVVAVDSGPPVGDVRVRRALTRAGLAPSRVSLLLMTHAHPDHVGGAAALGRWTGAPIATDVLERPYVEGRERAPAHPTGWVGRLFLHTPLPREPFEVFSPEITVGDDEFDLLSYGVNARVHRSGGHTKGSLSVYLPESGELLAGDLLAGGIGIGGVLFHGRVIEPPFHDNAELAHAAMAQVLTLVGLRTIHVCHGGPLRPSAVARWLSRKTGGRSPLSTAAPYRR